jgi:hypothetical protein
MIRAIAVDIMRDFYLLSFLLAGCCLHSITLSTVDLARSRGSFTMW